MEAAFAITGINLPVIAAFHFMIEIELQYFCFRKIHHNQNKMKKNLKMPLSWLFLLSIAIPACLQPEAQRTETSMKPIVQVFYKDKENSLNTLEQVRPFLENFSNDYDIQYIISTEAENEELIKSLGFPLEHFPFGIAINGKTCALINGDTIIFANFPDFMHHLGKHPGNWTLQHLEAVLNDKNLLLPDNPVITNRPGGH